MPRRMMAHLHMYARTHARTTTTLLCVRVLGVPPLPFNLILPTDTLLSLSNFIYQLRARAHISLTLMQSPTFSCKNRAQLFAHTNAPYRTRTLETFSPLWQTHTRARAHTMSAACRPNGQWNAHDELERAAASRHKSAQRQQWPTDRCRPANR